jgi:hypothetical protein
LRPENTKPPIQSGTAFLLLFFFFFLFSFLDMSLLVVSLGCAMILMHYGQWLFEAEGRGGKNSFFFHFSLFLLDRTFHYSGMLGLFNFVAGLYYTHFYLADRTHWKNW